ncbi:MAG: cell division protein SepF [Sarcina sp.]
MALAKLKNLFSFDGDDVYEEEYYEDDMEYGQAEQHSYNDNKVVHLNENANVKLLIKKPYSYEESSEVCDALKAGNIVIINTTALDVKIAQRLLDFVCGVTYTLDGDLQSVESRVYVATPANVEVSNEMKNELKESGLFSLNFKMR